MTEYPYDPDLPYVVESRHTGRFIARFALHEDARDTLHSEDFRIIDTTPKPRVPDDAKWITWMGPSDRWLAERVDGGWLADDGGIYEHLVDLPEITPDTVFTVLDERKS